MQKTFKIKFTDLLLDYYSNNIKSILKLRAYVRGKLAFIFDAPIQKIIPGPRLCGS